MEERISKILTVIVIFDLIKFVHGSDLECTELNEKHLVTELDIRRIVEEIASFHIPKLKVSVDIEEISEDYAALLMPELIKEYNYSVQSHIVTTADGYILTMFRIPNAGPAIFLMHGITGSSYDWILAGPNKSLAFILADQGYDVWMGNARGNKYSRRHAEMSANCEEFWAYSYDDIGRFDLPAMLAYVLDITRLKNLSFIGHSQGTTAFFVMCSELPEFNEKISLMIAISPLAFVTHAKSPILKILSYETDIKYVVLKAIGFHELIPNENFLNKTALAICENDDITQKICSNFNMIMYGCNKEQLEVLGAAKVFSSFPSSGSTRQFLHFAQGISSKSFRKYDIDETTNINRYGFPKPPSYNLENITAPIALLYSDEDWISNMTDVGLLKDKLPNVIKYKFIKNYSYMDWLMASNVKEKVYDYVLELANQYIKNNNSTL